MLEQWCDEVKIKPATFQFSFFPRYLSHIAYDCKLGMKYVVIYVGNNRIFPHNWCIILILQTCK